MECFLEELLSYPDVPSRWRMLDFDGVPPPFLTINYKWKNSTTPAVWVARHSETQATGVLA